MNKIDGFSKEELEVFENGFDAHHRGKQSLREIRGIIANEHPNNSKKLSKANQEKLLGYARHMIDKIRKEEFTVSSFEKNLGVAWNFCLFLGNRSTADIEKKDTIEWWELELDRFKKKQITRGTLKKYKDCVQTFLKWVRGLKHEQSLDIMAVLEMPKKAKKKLQERKTTQEEVKRLIEAAHVEGKTYSIRSQAIMALAADTGARISEILSMQNKHIRPEKNYLVVEFPESKTAPRRVISFLAKPYLEQWARLSPNKNKGNDAHFFCQADGSPCTYAVILKHFKEALKRSGIHWPEKKGLHYFRSLFASRAFEWAYALKHYWLGWSFRDEEKCYTSIDYEQCIDTYFQMIKKEHNPLAREDPVFWDEQTIDDTVVERLKEMPEFNMLLQRVFKETMTK